VIPLKHRYRFEDRTYSSVIDPDAEIFGSELHVELRLFEVVRETPRGAWVRPFMGSEVWVKNGPGKRLCHETPELAAESFAARKRRQIRIYKARLATAEAALYRIEHGRIHAPGGVLERSPIWTQPAVPGVLGMAPRPFAPPVAS